MIDTATTDRVCSLRSASDVDLVRERRTRFGQVCGPEATAVQDVLQANSIEATGAALRQGSQFQASFHEDVAVKLAGERIYGA